MATSTQTTTLPPWYYGYMQSALQRGQNLASTPFQAYGGQPAVGLNPYLQQAMGLTAQRAQAGNPLQRQAEQVIGDTMGGKFLQGNPYLDTMAAQTRQGVMSDVNKLFGANAWGGSAQQELLAKGMSQAENAMRYNDYANERANQLRAANFAPNLAASGYLDANMLNQAGTQLQGLNYNEFLRGQQWPFQANQAFINALGLNPGSTVSQQTPDPSRMSGILGGGLGGAALGQMAAPWLKDYGISEAWGPAVGAGIGGLLGAFF